MRSAKRLCLINRIPGVAGPASFQRRLAAGLAARGVDVCYSLDDRPYQAALVIGGTRQLGGLWRARRRGVRVLQRLDGMNWIHRKSRTGLRHYLRAESGNRLLRRIRERMADHVVYQSQFARTWWERVYGVAPAEASVVYNGVPLDVFTPEGPDGRPADRRRLLVVEGNLAGGYEIGLESAVELTRGLKETAGEVELVVAGNVPEAVRRRWEAEAPGLIRWMGLVPPEAIPALDRSAHVLFSADLHPACPNSVLEALACGLPVVAFATGALPELVTEEAGCLAPYGGDPWNLDPPDVAGLTRVTGEVLQNLARFRAGARARSEAAFGLTRMVDGYLDALGWSSV